MSARLTAYALENGLRLTLELNDSAVSLDFSGEAFFWLHLAACRAERAPGAFSVFDEEGVERVWIEGALQLLSQGLDPAARWTGQRDGELLVTLTGLFAALGSGQGKGGQAVDLGSAAKDRAMPSAPVRFHAFETGKRIHIQPPREPLEQREEVLARVEPDRPVALGRIVEALDAGEAVRPAEIDGGDGHPGMAGAARGLPLGGHGEASPPIVADLNHDESVGESGDRVTQIPTADIRGAR